MMNKISPELFILSCKSVCNRLKMVERDGGYEARYIATGHLIQNMGRRGGGELDRQYFGTHHDAIDVDWRVIQRFINQYSSVCLVNILIYRATKFILSEYVDVSFKDTHPFAIGIRRDIKYYEPPDE